MSMHSVDDLLNTNLKNVEEPAQIDESKLVEVPEVKVDHVEDKETVEAREEDRLNYLEQFRKDKEETLGKKEEIPKNDEKIPEQKEAAQLEDQVESKHDQEIDDYGNKIDTPKKKVYTAEEVEVMMRDRLARLKLEQQEWQKQQPQHPQQKINDAVQNFEADPASEESWETQLSNFVRHEIKKMESESHQKSRQFQEQKDRSEFEDRFTQGMSKYSDFVDVVSKQPITDDMVKATRGIKDPAAFVYAASKMYPKELERISQMHDAYQVAAEIGRLEERMKKSRGVTSAPKPANKTLGDMSDKYISKASVDTLILHDAKRKLRHK